MKPTYRVQTNNSLETFSNTSNTIVSSASPTLTATLQSPSTSCPSRSQSNNIKRNSIQGEKRCATDTSNSIGSPSKKIKLPVSSNSINLIEKTKHSNQYNIHDKLKELYFELLHGSNVIADKVRSFLYVQ